MDEQYNPAYIQELENRLQEQTNKTNNLSNSANSVFSSINDPNLIEYQLELDNILERIEHLLRGDVLVQDGENLIYKAPEDESLKPLNEYGVQFMMNTLSFYLNRNTILSNYSEERIKAIMYDFGYELTDQIYLNYEKMGLETADKQKRFAMIVLNIIHIVESAYMRSYRGEERESLRTARTVTQSDNPMMNRGMMPNNMMRNSKQFSFFSPKTWLK